MIFPSISLPLLLITLSARATPTMLATTARIKMRHIAHPTGPALRTNFARLLSAPPRYKFTVGSASATGRCRAISDLKSPRLGHIVRADKSTSVTATVPQSFAVFDHRGEPIAHA